MRSIEWFTRNPVAANLIMVLIVGGGLVSLFGGTIIQEVFPEFSIDLITIQVPYPGAAPEEVEEAICLRIEEAVQGLDGIKKLTSNARENVGGVTIHVETGADSRKLLDDVKARVDAIDTFPEETEKPIIQELTNRRQVIDVAVHGDTDELSLRRLAERVRDDLAALPEISAVELANARPYEVSAPVMKGASNARAIWTIELDFDAEGLPVVDERFLEMGAEVGPDEDYAAIDRKWHDKLYEIFPFLAAQVGEVAVPLDATEERIRSTENGWGNFIVDQMRTAFGDAPADLAFINSGTLRIDDIVVGDITFEDIARTFAFSSYLRYMTVSGREFRKLMETGYRGSGSQGYFPQVSGFRVCVDRSLPDGERIVSLQVPDEDGWQEIGTDTEYTLVVPDFLYRGGDGYVLSQDRPASRPGSELKYLVLDAILRAQAEGRAVGALPDPANPRFVELGADRGACWGP